MLEFLHPLWFAGLAVLLIPLVIHLWNRQESRLVKVGSIRWLKVSEMAATEPSRTGSRSLRNLQLSDLLLFFLRCLLLVLLVLLMTEPQWLFSRDAPADWVMFSPGLINDKTVMQKVDSCRQAGYRAYFFSPGFVAYQPENRTASDTVPRSAPDSWTLLRELELRRSEFNKLVVYAPATLGQARGTRPSTSDSAQVRLVVVPAKGSEVSWLAEAVRTPRNQFSLHVGITDSRATRYEQYLYPFPGQQGTLPQGSSPLFELVGAGDQWKVRQVADSTFREVINEKSLKVLIRFDGNRREDAVYIRNAVVSAAEFLQKEVDVTVQEINRGEAAGRRQDYIFHLSATSFRDTTKATVISDAADHTFESLNRGVQGNDVSGSRLLQRIPPRQKGEAIWTDGFGVPLLHKTASGRYVFYSRFHPLFCTIAEEPALARWMLTLLFPGAPDEEPDHRAISSSQLQPTLKTHMQPVAASAAETTSLHTLLWMLLLLCLLAERIVAMNSRH